MTTGAFVAERYSEKYRRSGRIDSVPGIERRVQVSRELITGLFKKKSTPRSRVRGWRVAGTADQGVSEVGDIPVWGKGSDGSSG